MSYADTANRPNPTAMVGALGVPGAFAVLLVFGLAVTVVTPPIIDNPKASFFPLPEPEVPPEPVEQQPTTSTTQPTTQTQEIPTTRPDSPFEFEFTETGAVTESLGLDEPIGPVGPVDFGVPEFTPAADPIAASPRGVPGTWITDNDYRTSWINRGFEGRASFELSIDTRGRVSDCRITGSTGYQALDTATCRLLERRARFNPAKDSAGNNVAGSYSSSVRWRIPE